MAHADPSGAKKRSTRKTKSTRDEDAFVYDFGLPPVHFPSATDQQLKTEESHKGDTPLNTVHALSPQQQQMLAVDHILAEPNHLAQKISLVQAERDKLALELELLRLKQAQSTPPPPSGAAKGQGTSASPPMTRKKRHVDWPHEFCPGMSTNVEYEKLDLAEFVAGYLAMIKTYDPEATKFMLRHLELLMIKGISYTWSAYLLSKSSCIAWNGLMPQKFAIERTLFSNTRIYVLHPPLARRPRPLPQRAQNRTGIKKTGVVGSGTIQVLALVTRTKTHIPLNTSVVFALRTILCFIVRREEIPFRQPFDNASQRHPLLPSIGLRT